MNLSSTLVRATNASADAPGARRLALVAPVRCGLTLALARQLACDGHDLVLLGATALPTCAAQLRDVGASVQVWPLALATRRERAGELASRLSERRWSTVVIDADADAADAPDAGGPADVLHDMQLAGAWHATDAMALAHAAARAMHRHGGGRVLLLHTPQRSPVLRAPSAGHDPVALFAQHLQRAVVDHDVGVGRLQRLVGGWRVAHPGLWQQTSTDRLAHIDGQRAAAALRWSWTVAEAETAALAARRAWLALRRGESVTSIATDPAPSASPVPRMRHRP